jgi:hypothetical protein
MFGSGVKQFRDGKDRYRVKKVKEAGAVSNFVIYKHDGKTYKYFSKIERASGFRMAFTKFLEQVRLKET